MLKKPRDGDKLARFLQNEEVFFGHYRSGDHHPGRGRRRQRARPLAASGLASCPSVALSCENVGRSFGFSAQHDVTTAHIGSYDKSVHSAGRASRPPWRTWATTRPSSTIVVYGLVLAAGQQLPCGDPERPQVGLLGVPALGEQLGRHVPERPRAHSNGHLGAALDVEGEPKVGDLDRDVCDVVGIEREEQHVCRSARSRCTKPSPTWKRLRRRALPSRCRSAAAW